MSKLKDFFKFKSGTYIYSATKEADDQWRIRNTESGWESSGLYREAYFKEYRYHIIDEPEQFNGIDAEGNPLDFTDEDFQPFQRALLRNGDIKMVTLDQKGNKLLVSADGMWQMARVEPGFGEGKFDVMEVYSPPRYSHLTAIVEEHGKVVWKRTDPAKEALRKQLESDIQEARSTLADLEEKLAELN